MPGCCVGKYSTENRCTGMISKACEAGGGKHESPVELAFKIHQCFNLEEKDFSSFSKPGCTLSHGT